MGGAKGNPVMRRIKELSLEGLAVHEVILISCEPLKAECQLRLSSSSQEQMVLNGPPYETWWTIHEARMAVLEFKDFTRELY